MSAVFLSVTIDCECDKGAQWRTQRPLRFEGIQEGVGQRLAPLFRHHGAKPTYLLSPEVFRDPASVELLAKQRPSAELGTHLHGEYAEPCSSDPVVTLDFQRDYSPELELAKLTSLTELYRSAFGASPRSFRAGRFGIGPASIGCLESLGYSVDSSVTPRVSWERAGARGLSFQGAPTQPYHPSRACPGEPGESTLVEVPVTIRPHPWSRVPLLGRLFEPRWLRPTHGTSARLRTVAREEIRAARRQATRGTRTPVVLNAMFHNVEVIADASPYARTESDAERILSRIGALLEFAARESIRVVGLSDIAELFA
jgi:hypothetical protein